MSSPAPSGFPAGILEDLSVRMARMETDVSWIKREMATKADLADLRTELKDEIGSQRAEPKGESGSQRAEMFAMETRIIKWMVGTTLTGMGMTAAVTVALLKLVG
jgi:hypothetical protein